MKDLKTYITEDKTSKIEYSEFRKAIASLSENKLYTFFGIGDKREYMNSCEKEWNKLSFKEQEKLLKYIKMLLVL